MTFVTNRSRAWTIQRVAVAIADATYDAVLANARANRDDGPSAFPAVHLTSTQSTKHSHQFTQHHTLTMITRIHRPRGLHPRLFINAASHYKKPKK